MHYTCSGVHIPGHAPIVQACLSSKADPETRLEVLEVLDSADLVEGVLQYVSAAEWKLKHVGYGVL